MDRDNQNGGARRGESCRDWSRAGDFATPACEPLPSGITAVLQMLFLAVFSSSILELLTSVSAPCLYFWQSTVSGWPRASLPLTTTNLGPPLLEPCPFPWIISSHLTVVVVTSPALAAVLMIERCIDQSPQRFTYLSGSRPLRLDPAFIEQHKACSSRPSLDNPDEQPCHALGEHPWTSIVRGRG